MALSRDAPPSVAQANSSAHDHLPFQDTRDLDAATRGLVAELDPPAIAGQDGKPVPCGQLAIPVVQLPAFANGAALVVLAPLGVMPLLGLSLAAGLAVASVLPLVGRKPWRTPLFTWGMVIAHLGVAVALAGMASDSLFTRERLGSTGLGQGIAIPHGRIKGLKDAAGAFLRLAAPVQFDAPDGRPVSMLFVLLVRNAIRRARS